MSLFRVRDFWSFDLDQLPDYYGSRRKTVPFIEAAPDVNEDHREEEGEPPAGGAGEFIVSLGRFHSIGRHDVFVCGNLNGLICILQVPENEQPKIVDNQKHHKDSERSSSKSPPDDDLAQRQLLCASQLGFTIVDLKCGHFTSTLKQSIAVLSFDRLIVYQVKRRQVDLLTAPIGADQSSFDDAPLGGAFDESLFSHRLEEHHRIELLKQELPANLTLLNGNYKHTINENTHPQGSSDSSSEPPSKEASLRNRNKQLQLPQRDLIVVQYQNQFIFTLVDHKKVVGHFSLCEGELSIDAASGDREQEKVLEPESSSLEKLSKFMGPMPMAYIRDSSSSKGLNLVISMTDNRVHCIQMSKLMALAKQSVMKRVARDLMSKSSDLKSSLSYDNQSFGCITIDLVSMTEWTLELAYAPIQMNSIQRLGQPIIKTKEMPTLSQLLVMSRYYIDLFSSSGQHLWSQRFENPLICVYSYTLPVLGSITSETDEDPPKTDLSRTQGHDRMLSLVCTDCLSADKCNLLVLDEERIAWSALLNTKPMQFWRANLSKMMGAMAALDSNKARLSISYLGTNLNSQGEQLQFEAESEGSESQLDQLCNLDDNSAGLIGTDTKNKKMEDPLERQRGRLEVDICLEANNQWPDVQVSSRIKIRSEASSLEVIQNIVATLEFDDLIEFETKDFKFTTLSGGVVQVQLGSCWPDRREPIQFNGQFSLRSTRNLESLNSGIDFAGKNQHLKRDPQLLSMPKSLKVKLYLRFNFLHSGTLLQEESFMLPLNMVARLAHIDYSSGQNQTLDDFMANLNLYKRQPASYMLLDDVSNPEPLHYYLCDLFIKTRGDIIDLADEIIESDLVCRGFNSETENSSLLRPKDRRERNMGTLENINLLAQSLDCRLKYNSLAHSIAATKVMRQSSEEYSPAIMMSIAMKVPSGAHIIQGLPTNGDRTDLDDGVPPYAILWLHLCDLLPSNNSTLSKEMVKLHLKEWKAHEYSPDKCMGDVLKDIDSNSSDRPILISIECDYPMPILFLQNHLIGRLKRPASMKSHYQFNVRPLSESMHDAIEVNCEEIFKLDNFMAISVNLCDRLTSTLKDYDNNLRKEFKRLKGELAKEYCKFHVSTMSSLALSKRLINLPDSMHQQFSKLSSLTKQYQLNLIRTLSQLEKLKKLDYQYSKVSGTSDIVIEVREQKLLDWPDFTQIID